MVVVCSTILSFTQDLTDTFQLCCMITNPEQYQPFIILDVSERKVVLFSNIMGTTNVEIVTT